VVIGCSGLSGNFFIERLARENYKKKIKCLSRMSSDVEHLKKYDLNLEFRLVNFEDDEALRNELLGSNTVLNIAGIYLSEKIIHAGLAAGVQWFINFSSVTNFLDRKCKIVFSPTTTLPPKLRKRRHAYRCHGQFPECEGVEN
jgi:saccharopine dehydrogenase-like NADP-dependent oxidoreductase